MSVYFYLRDLECFTLSQLEPLCVKSTYTRVRLVEFMKLKSFPSFLLPPSLPPFLLSIREQTY